MLITMVSMLSADKWRGQSWLQVPAHHSNRPQRYHTRCTDRYHGTTHTRLLWQPRDANLRCRQSGAIRTAMVQRQSSSWQ